MSDFYNDYKSGKFEHNIKHPTKTEFTSIKICEFGCEHKIFNEEGYNQALKNWHEAESNRCKEMRKAIFKQHGVETNHRCANLIWEEAWNRGHSAGWEEVCSIFGDVAYFVEKIIIATLAGN